MKGITPIIATIILLLIAVAIAGAAWAYISGYWSGQTARAVEITGAACNGGVASLFIKNIGTQSIDTTTDLQITRGPTAFTTLPTCTPSSAGPNGATTCTEATTDDCGPSTRCTYRVIVGGRVSETAVVC